jgi:hypothetical protein
MLLVELFDTKIEYSVEKHTPYKFVAKANVGQHEIMMTCEQDSDGDPWTLVFETDGRIAATGDFETRHYDDEVQGSEFQVFSVVKSMMIEFIHDYRPEELLLSGSKSEHRGKIYEKMLKRILNSITYPKYRLFVDHGGLWATQSQFKMKRKDN